MRAARRPALLAAAALLALALAAPGQEAGDAPPPPATLVADSVRIDAAGRLVAEGAVEALQGDTRLTAARVIYDRTADRLMVEGPITIETEGNAVVLASGAELAPDLRDGLLRSARLVLDRRLQLGAAELNRVEGRYTQLSRVVASSCEVCAARPVPLWQIRASRVVHDEAERQLYFDDARFEVYGIPVFYLPRLRLPDPTVERATGFLVPQFVTTDAFGPGVKLPYFFALAPDRDLTLTPYLAIDRTVTLEARYRQAYRTGTILFEGAISQDDVREDELRGYLFGRGGFVLDGGYRLAFDIETASDRDVLDDYGITGKDRLDSAISIQRGRPDRWVGAEAIYFYEPGADRANDEQTAVLADLAWRRRFTAPVLGGAARLAFTAHAHQRPSGDDIVGRDVGRITAEAGWRGDAVGPAGLVYAGEARLLAEWTQINDDSRHEVGEARAIPAAAAELSWPLARTGADGARHLVAPTAQLVWTPDDAVTDRPVDESVQLELDEGNLFTLSRFAAGDRVEAGLRANLGLSYTRDDPDGWSMGLTVGRVLRAEDLGQFDGYEAFEGTRSDWLLGAGLDIGTRFSLDGRALFEDGLDGNRVETRMGWRGEGFDLAGSYAWLAPSPVESRPEATNQWRLDGAVEVSARWRASADLAYDLRRERAAETELGLEYRTDCITWDVELSRRYASDRDDSPDTAVTVQVALAGFGAGEGPRPRRLGCAR